MSTVGVAELKTHASALLRRVAAGETVRISVRGVEIAEIRPLSVRTNADAMAEIAELTKDLPRLTRDEWREGVLDGRR